MTDSSDSSYSSEGEVPCSFTKTFESSSSSDECLVADKVTETGPGPTTANLSGEEINELRCTTKYGLIEQEGKIYPKECGISLSGKYKALIDTIAVTAKERKAWTFINGTLLKQLTETVIKRSSPKNLVCDVCIFSSTRPLVVLSVMTDIAEKGSMIEYNSRLARALIKTVQLNGETNFSVVNGIIDADSCDTFQEKIDTLEYEALQTAIPHSLEMNRNKYKSVLFVFLQCVQDITVDDNGSEISTVFDSSIANKLHHKDATDQTETAEYFTNDSLADIWSCSFETMPKLKKAGTQRSVSLSHLEEGDDVIFEKTKIKEPKMSRDHWEKGRITQRCNGCQRRINLVFKRHHCRMCGKIYCQNCSRFKRRLSSDSTPNPDGDLHRVCLYCKDGDDVMIGFAKSWTKDFMNMRLAAHARKFPIEKEPELKLLCEIPKICLPVTDLFLADINKGKQLVVKTKLQNAVKAAKRNSDCSACGRPLYVPKDRKECVVCDDIFCSKCSTKNLVVYYPRGTVQPADMERGRVQPAMDVMTSGIDMSTMADHLRNYRTCNPCEKQMEQELHVFHFNSRLRDNHSELMDLGGQIRTTLDRAIESKAREAKLKHSISLESLEQTGDRSFDGIPRSQSDVFSSVLSTCEAKMAEQHVTQKLFDRYWAIFNLIRTQLKPVTHTQTTLHKHVLAAASSFYSDTRWYYRVRDDSGISTASD